MSPSEIQLYTTHDYTILFNHSYLLDYHFKHYWTYLCIRSFYWNKLYAAPYPSAAHTLYIVVALVL